MSGHHGLRAFLSGGGDKKKIAAEMDLAASQAPLLRGTQEPSGSAEALACERGYRFVVGGGSPRRLDSTP